MRKICIYLGDLVHTWEKIGTWTMPLNIGLIGAYAIKELGGQVELQLFKCPTKMINAIKSSPPDVVALSHYVWNTNLNGRVFEVAKTVDPEILTVGGGPIFTSHNTNQEVLNKFFNVHKKCDAWVLDQGERGFVALMRALLKNNVQASQVCIEPIAGCITFSPARTACFGPDVELIGDLDEIPSPYLTGLLDPFFEMGMTPLIETNRSCPYRCTFCAFGIGASKLTRYSTERLIGELDYIADRSKKAAHLFIADANFSILPRDADLARHIYECHLNKGWPSEVASCWNKANPKQVLKVAKELRGLSPIGASMESLNPDTLKAIKRVNLPLEKVVEIVGELDKFNGKSNSDRFPIFSELIAGLPEETLEDHLTANRTLMDIGADVQNYNLHLIPGTEMETKAGREEFVRKTSWRLHDNAFGIYDNVPVFEGQEVVKETTTTSKEEIRSLRFIHFLLQFMWGKRWYHAYLVFLEKLGSHPVDTVLRIAEECSKDQGVIGKVYKDFSADHDLESFETPGVLFRYWGEPQNLERLRKGDYGKLNFQYTFIILREYPDAFDEFLLDATSKIISELSSDKKAECMTQCANILRFLRERRAEITNELSVVSSKCVEFDYDIAAWLQEKRVGMPKRAAKGTVFEYEFFLPSKRLHLLENKLNQYKSCNINLTLRKMAEHVSPQNLFYEVRGSSLV